jgi:cold shock CspA family protein
MVSAMLAVGKAAASTKAARGSSRKNAHPRAQAGSVAPTRRTARSEEEAKKMWLDKLNQPLGKVTSARPTVKRGTVKFYKQDKGWGYIQPAKKGEIDVFVHYSSIKKDGWRSLRQGEPVEYTVVVHSDGRVACGTVTGPDGSDVQGDRPDGVPEPEERLRVANWLHPHWNVDAVVFTKRHLIDDDDEDFDDTIYLNEEDYFSN